jgi:putative transposase
VDAAWAVEAAAAARVPVLALAVPAPARVEEDRSQRLQTLPFLPKTPKSGDFGLHETHIMVDAIFKTAPHNPPHWFVPGALYMLTGAIYSGADLIESPKRKTEWRDAFYEAAKIYQWQIIAWVVLHNHYHAIVQSPEHATNLWKFISSYHKFTARKWNNEDGLSGRKVWWNYWDICIRSEEDYYTRLRYVFWNPVKHELVGRPEDYSFSNYETYLSLGFDLTGISEVNDVPEF